MVYFERFIVVIDITSHIVSILVLMDGVLRASKRAESHKNQEVSILVLMDGVLREAYPTAAAAPTRRFNPCSNGWCTSRVRTLSGECVL